MKFNSKQYPTVITIFGGTGDLGKDGGKHLADEFDIALLGQIPIVQSIREGGDAGVPVMVGNDDISRRAFEEFAGQAVRSIAMRNANLPATKIQEILE